MYYCEPTSKHEVVPLKDEEGAKEVASQRRRLASAFYSKTWLRLQIERVMEELGGRPPRSNISPFGHQIRAFEPTTSHVPRRGPKTVNALRHPAPNLMSFLASMCSANADVFKSTNTAMADTSSLGAPLDDLP